MVEYVTFYKLLLHFHRHKQIVTTRWSVRDFSEMIFDENNNTDLLYINSLFFQQSQSSNRACRDRERLNHKPRFSTTALRLNITSQVQAIQPAHRNRSANSPFEHQPCAQVLPLLLSKWPKQNQKPAPNLPKPHPKNPPNNSTNKPSPTSRPANQSKPSKPANAF